MQWVSTTEVGNVFRDQICTLLRTKYPDAEVERRIDGTKVDMAKERLALRIAWRHCTRGGIWPIPVLAYQSSIGSERSYTRHA